MSEKSESHLSHQHGPRVANNRRRVPDAGCLSSAALPNVGWIGIRSLTWTALPAEFPRPDILDSFFSAAAAQTDDWCDGQRIARKEYAAVYISTDPPLKYLYRSPFQCHPPQLLGFLSETALARASCNINLRQGRQGQEKKHERHGRKNPVHRPCLFVRAAGDPRAELSGKEQIKLIAFKSMADS